MSSPPPEHGSSPEEALFEGDPDADTGPVQIVQPDNGETSIAPTSFAGQVPSGGWPQGHPQQADDDPNALRTQYWHANPAPPPEASPSSTMVAPPPVGESYANRFTAPLTVDPRATKVKSIGVQPVTVLAIVGAVVLAAALVFLLINLFSGSSASDQAGGAPPRKAQPADQQKLESILPQGYSASACAPLDPPDGALAKVSCSANSDAGGPPSATYTLFGDASALKTAFDGVVGAARQVNCPGNIQSPGPWRRNAAPDVVAGTVFCGFRQDVPTVAWTDDAKLMVASVDGAPTGPNLDLIYTWWRGHL